jgi:hypothetical protein
METLGKSRHKWNNIKIDHREIGWEGKVCTGFIWLKIEICGVLVFTQQRNFGFKKSLGNSCVTDWLLDSQFHRAS